MEYLLLIHSEIPRNPEAITETAQPICEQVRPFRAKKSNHRQCRLLRTRREWPNSGCSSCFDERASPQLSPRSLRGGHRIVSVWCYGRCHVRFGSEADMCSAKRHVRFTPESDHESGH